MYVILQENFQDILSSEKRDQGSERYVNCATCCVKMKGEKSMNVYLFLYENIVIIYEGELQQDLEDR